MSGVVKKRNKRFSSYNNVQLFSNNTKKTTGVEISLVINAQVNSFADLWIIPLTFTQVFCHQASLLSQFLTEHFTNKPFAPGRAGLGTVAIATIVAHSFFVFVA